MLPVELALRDRPPAEICAAYGIDLEQFQELLKNEFFKADLEARVQEMKADGVSFRMKARLQAEQLLLTSWNIIHNPKTPAAVKAKMIETTFRVAGLDASKDQSQGLAGVANSLQIQINLGDR
jgi:hypothetical protein